MCQSHNTVKSGGVGFFMLILPVFPAICVPKETNFILAKIGIVYHDHS